MHNLTSLAPTPSPLTSSLAPTPSPLTSPYSHPQLHPRWRTFFWSYRDYNNTVLRLAHSTASFEAFVALGPMLPSHNQQSRMLAGVRAEVVVDAAVLERAVENLCAVQCVGVLGSSLGTSDTMEPFLKCLGVLFGADRQTFELSWRNVRHGGDARVISQSARALVRAYSWADHALYDRALELVKQRRG